MFPATNTPRLPNIGVTSTPGTALMALDELQRAVDLLTDALLSHLAYEERELFDPLALHGLG